MFEFFHSLADHAHDLILGAPYIWIFVLMTIESSFIPFPSEVVMIPAGYFAATGKIHFFLGLMAGLAGSLLGASINYVLGYYGGSVLAKKLLSDKYYNICVHYFEKHGDSTTLIGRFIPAIRQLISLPTGVFRMHFGKFFLYTGLGAGIWCLILMVFGYIAGENQALFSEYKYHFTFGVLILVSIAIYVKIKIIQYLSKSTEVSKHLKK